MTVTTPVLRVRCPKWRREERCYLLLTVFDGFMGIGVDICAEDRSDTCIEAIRGGFGTITMSDAFFQKSDRAWLQPESVPETWIGMLDPARFWPDSGLAPIPVVFGDHPKGGDWLCFDDKGGARCSADLLGAAFFFLTRYEECAKPAFDAHGRISLTSGSLGAYAEFCERPFVDDSVEILWCLLKQIFPFLQRKSHRYRFCLSHDLDRPYLFSSCKNALRSAAYLGLRKQRLGDMVRYLCAGIKCGLKLADDPYVQGMRVALAVAEGQNVRTTIFLKGSRQGPHDCGYELARFPGLGQLVQEASSGGHELGFHAGYETMDNPLLFHEEINRLRGMIGREVCQVRQHYLRLRVPDTWRIQEANGLQVDSTLGFHSRCGFRAGTCREYPIFDLYRRRGLRLRERSLIVMDSGLRQCLARGEGPAQAVQRVCNLCDLVRKKGGVFTLLWHNSSFFLDDWEQWRDVYRESVRYCAKG